MEPSLLVSTKKEIQQTIEALKRSDIDRITPSLRLIGQFKYLMDGLTHPIPSDDIFEKHTIVVLGGMRHGGKYPDIIIDQGDFVRARKILDSANQATFSTIVKFVRHAFHTAEAIKYRLVDNVVISQMGAIGKARSCFLSGVFDCTTPDACNEQKATFPNTFTNVTALPYLMGDCREHAWLCGFFGRVVTGKDNIRILYTRAFSVNDKAKTIKYVEDHVFVLYWQTDETVYVIDPFYETVTIDAPMYVKYNSVIPTLVPKESLVGYTGLDALATVAAPLLHCGNSYVGGKHHARIINIPIIYNGTYNLIESSIIDPMIVTVMNRKMRLASTGWPDFNVWCRDRHSLNS